MLLANAGETEADFWSIHSQEPHPEVSERANRDGVPVMHLLLRAAHVLAVHPKAKVSYGQRFPTRVQNLLDSLRHGTWSPLPKMKFGLGHS